MNANEKGSLFILTLWALVVLSIFAIGLAGKVFQDIRLASYFQNKPRAQYLAEAAIKRVGLGLKKNNNLYLSLNDLRRLAQSADGKESMLKGIQWHGGKYRLLEDGVVDEARKTNLNTATEEVLEKLFQIAAKVKESDARVIAQSIIDWRDPDTKPMEDGAENEYYQQLIPPYKCKDDDFEVLQELLLVRGMTPQIFSKVKDFLTIYGEGKVNINTASQTVLQAMGLGEVLANKIINYRRGEDSVEGTEDDNILKSEADIFPKLSFEMGMDMEQIYQLAALTAKGMLSINSEYFRIQAEGKFGDRVERIDCVVDKSLNVKYWRE